MIQGKMHISVLIKKFQDDALAAAVPVSDIAEFQPGHLVNFKSDGLPYLAGIVIPVPPDRDYCTNTVWVEFTQLKRNKGPFAYTISKTKHFISKKKKNLICKYENQLEKLIDHL